MVYIILVDIVKRIQGDDLRMERNVYEEEYGNQRSFRKRNY